MMNVLQWCLENLDLIVMVVLFTIALLRTTKWGKANAEALDVVVSAIERNQSRLIKRDVATADLSDDALDVLDDAVHRVDDKKMDPEPGVIMARELAKTIGLKTSRKR